MVGTFGTYEDTIIQKNFESHKKLLVWLNLMSSYDFLILLNVPYTIPHLLLQ